MEGLLTIDRAAELLGISPWTVRKMLANKRLASVRFSRRVLIEPSEIRRLVEEGREKAKVVAQAPGEVVQ
jgi:excisionase family DNA binding protein